MVSYLETIIRKFLNYYLSDFVATYNERPDFLKNEKTGKNFICGGRKTKVNLEDLLNVKLG